MIFVQNLEEARKIAKCISEWIIKYHKGVCFDGPIGIGKSTIIAMVLHNLGFDYKGSPTYIMAREYEDMRFKIVHIDLYQSTSTDLIYYTDYIPLIEWPSKCKNITEIFGQMLFAHICWHGNDERNIMFSRTKFNILQ